MRSLLGGNHRRAHWADVFAANGTLTTYSWYKSSGKWRVQQDELCIDRGNDDGGCYQVWVWEKVELGARGQVCHWRMLQKQSVRR